MNTNRATLPPMLRGVARQDGVLLLGAWASRPLNAILPRAHGAPHRQTPL